MKKIAAISMAFFSLLITQHTVAQNDTAKKLLYKDIFYKLSGGKIIFGNACLETGFDRQTGDWVTFSDGRSNSIIHPSAGNGSFDCKIDTGWLLNNNPHHFTGYRIQPDPQLKNVTLTLCFALKQSTDQYGLEVMYMLAAASPVLTRSMRLTCLEAGDKRMFNGFRFALPGVCIDAPVDCRVAVPGPFFPSTFLPPETPYDSLLNRHIRFHSAPDAGFGVLAMASGFLSAKKNEQGKVLATWMNTEGTVNDIPAIDGDPDRITFSLEDLRYQYLRTGMSVVSDDQRIYFAKGTIRDALNTYEHDVSGSFPLASTPSWVAGMQLLELYPAYFKGGFKEITARLSYYRSIGFNTLYLMPHWEGGYSPIDFYSVNPAYGSQEDLQQLVAAAHRQGMRVLFDMVIHGFNTASPVVKAHPELFIHAADGSVALHPTWKSVSTDWAATAYLQYMVELVKHDLNTYHIDGYRVDAASYKGPNWDTAVHYPAYLSGASSPVLLRLMLDAMRKIQPQAVMLSEVFGPVFYTVSNLVHDNQTEAVESLTEKIKQGRYTISQYRQHIDHVYVALPAGAHRVFFSRNHDTSWFYHFGGYSPLFKLFEAIHACYGIPEVFAGDPRNGPSPDSAGIYRWYKKLFACRNKYPELINGRVRLHDTNCSNPNIFTGIRESADHTALTVMHAAGKDTVCSISLPEDVHLSKPVILNDVETGTAVACKKNGVHSCVINVKAYQVLVGRIR